jgi:TPR repeat protein
MGLASGQGAAMLRALLVLLIPMTLIPGALPVAPETSFAGAQDPLALTQIFAAPDPETEMASLLARLRADGQGGDMGAQALLGNMYYWGKGVTPDFQEARVWFQMAAEQGHPTSQTKLGAMCYLGQGMPRDLQESVKWFRLAADQGEPDAQDCMGGLYATGEGVAQDLVEAFSWLLQARDGGAAQAARHCMLIMTHLTPGQIREGARRAKEAAGKRENPRLGMGE